MKKIMNNLQYKYELIVSQYKSSGKGYSEQKKKL